MPLRVCRTPILWPNESVSAGIAISFQDKKLVWSSAAHITAARSCRLFDIFDQLLAGAFACSSCLSHRPLLSGYDEPKTLSYQITLFGPIGADVRQSGTTLHLIDGGGIVFRKNKLSNPRK